jgi:hypothetical protein
MYMLIIQLDQLLITSAVLGNNCSSEACGECPHLLVVAQPRLCHKLDRRQGLLGQCKRTP